MPPDDSAEGEPADSPFDAQTALTLAGDDRELLQRLVDLFFVHTPTLVAELGRAIASGDAAAVELIAHRLAGSAAMFGAHRARIAARGLEDIGRTGDLAGAAGAHAAVEAEFSRLATALRTLQR